MDYTLIIPVYNAKKYLREAVDSGLAQTLSPREIILIDDGSSDGSGKICDDYALSYPDKVKVIHRENGGPSAARNTGIDAASTEWIMFLDADDVLHHRAAEILSAGVHEDVDMVAGGFSKRSLIQNLMAEDFRKLTGNEALAEALYQRGIDHSPWGKLLRRSILADLRFAEGMIYEDLDLFYRYCEVANNIASTTIPIVYYRQHASSIIHTWRPERSDVLEITDRIEAKYAEGPDMLRKASRDRRFSAYCNMYLLACRHGDESLKERCVPVIKSHRKGAIADPHTRAKNKAGALLSYLGLWALRLADRL